MSDITPTESSHKKEIYKPKLAVEESAIPLDKLNVNLETELNNPVNYKFVPPQFTRLISAAGKPSSRS